jgi:hypothetical protein
MKDGGAACAPVRWLACGHCLVFDCGELFNALDARRRDLGLGW